MAGLCANDPAPHSISQVSTRHSEEESASWDMPGFKVPVARTSRGSLVRAMNASHGKSYFCPGCDAPLTLRKGDVRAAHFAHRHSGCCSPETALHKGAKAWIAARFRRRLQNRGTWLPKLAAPCRGTKDPAARPASGACKASAWFDLRDLDYDEVAEERMTDDGLRPDVLLLKGGSPILGIEVLVTHAVGAAKAERTGHPWIEMDAQQLIDSPKAWRPAAGRFPWTSLCQQCQRLERIRAIAFSEHCGPEDCAAETAAEFFMDALNLWLSDPRVRKRLSVAWKCPACWKKTQRRLSRQLILDGSRSSALGPPIRPEVVLHLANRTHLILSFATPLRPVSRRNPVRLETTRQAPVIHCTLSLRNPFVLEMHGTNRPAAFLCGHCQGDCAGFFPLPWSPLPWPEAVPLAYHHSRPV